MAPRARFELATLRLTAECSTIELPGIRAGKNGAIRAGNSLTNRPQKCQRTGSSLSCAPFIKICHSTLPKTYRTSIRRCAPGSKTHPTMAAILRTAPLAGVERLLQWNRRIRGSPVSPTKPNACPSGFPPRRAGLDTASRSLLTPRCEEVPTHEA